MSSTKIAIVNYQAGNLRSVQKALEKFGVCTEITSDVDQIKRADGLVFPGQGSCDSSMMQLNKKNLVDPIREYISTNKPFLGICLGLQLLFDRSDEGIEPCLGVLKGYNRRFPKDGKVPHMGWNQVEFDLKHRIFDDIDNGSNFYFVHSYYAVPDDHNVVAGHTTYGVKFCSAVAWGNVTAVQFHPEKSGVTGLKIYKNFIKLVRESKCE